MRHAADEYEIQRGPFNTIYRGVCTIDPTHLVKPGDEVAIVQRADNPMLPVSGVACHRCIRMMARAR